MFLQLPKEISALTLAIREMAEQLKHDSECRKPSRNVTKADLLALEERLKVKNSELASLLDKMTLQTGKVAKEQSDRFDVLTKRIDELTNAIGDDADPAVVTAQANLQAALDNLDSAIPDPPGVPPTPPEPDQPV